VWYDHHFATHANGEIRQIVHFVIGVWVIPFAQRHSTGGMIGGTRDRKVGVHQECSHPSTGGSKGDLGEIVRGAGARHRGIEFNFTKRITIAVSDRCSAIPAVARAKLQTQAL